MNYKEPTSPKRSLGALFRNNKTKPRSPDFTGKLRLQRLTFEAFQQQFSETEDDEMVCNIAAWVNHDAKGDKYLTIEISPKYVPPVTNISQADFLDWLPDGETYH
jgi:hypothetical protein